MKIDYKELVSQWEIKLKSVRSDLKVYGSPDRYLDSFVIQDTKGVLYVVEKIGYFEHKRREELSQILWSLNENGLDKITPYLPDRHGNFVTEYKLRSWQIRKYISGEKTDRRNYFYESWRGECAGEFLNNLNRISNKTIIKGEIKKISEYSVELMRKSEGLEGSSNIYKYIEKNYLPIEEKIGTSFCHGDFHPLNIIWGKSDICGVIDWEFAGRREKLLDIANMIGCIGSENPELIFTGMAEKFLYTVFENNENKNNSEYLVDMLIALRYAGWLSLWLRADDKPMVPREIQYITYLIENKMKFRDYFMKCCKN